MHKHTTIVGHHAISHLLFIAILKLLETSIVVGLVLAVLVRLVRELLLFEVELRKD